MTDAGSGPEVYGGRYELEHRIARGGMADVYLARDLLLDRPVALKVLFPEFATDHSFVERFRREATAAASLNHPNIVSVYDTGEEGSTYFIVMEYIEGRTLSQILRDEGPLEPRRAAEVTIDIANALASAHRNGVVHRDVKPGNVILSPSGQVKVTDFGIARAISAGDNLTQTGTVMGTATYFSPEQARGEPVDPRSDVYSLGIVLYELLVGAPPFRGDSPVSVAYKHVSEQAELPRSRDPRIPAALEAVTMRAIAKNPANRYASAEAFAADLRRFHEGRAVEAESVLPPEDATQTVAAAALGDATRAVPRADATRTMTAVDDDRTAVTARRSPLFIGILVALAAVLLAGVVALASGLGNNGGGGAVTVPRVIGLTQEQADAALKKAGLKGDFQPEKSDTVAAGTVISQDPADGSAADKGNTIVVKVSAGKEPVAVPDLVDRTETDALLALQEAGLKGSITHVENDSVEPGRVLEQNPQAGAKAEPGDTIQLTVSQGPADVAIPDVTGMTPTQAANELGRAGFVVDTNTADEPSSQEAGTVARTNPPAGQSAPKGSTVQVFTSSGPETPVPDVRGETQVQAIAQLRRAGYAVSRVSQDTGDITEDGIVLDQSPEPDTQAARGSTVTIYVGRFVAATTTTTTTSTSTTF